MSLAWGSWHDDAIGGVSGVSVLTFVSCRNDGLYECQSRGKQQIQVFDAVLDLTLAMRARSDTDANAKSTAPAEVEAKENEMAGAESVEKLEDVIVRSAEQVAGQVRAAREAIATVIFGQERVIENTLVTILSGGHALLIGVPGLAKTKLVETLGITLGLDAKRIQFTPDLMPSDILGAEVLDESSSGKRSFRFIAGPVFAQLLMADEINRASPRTQSALLQAMQEQHITVAGARHDLPKPFHVLATQNPLEQEGTYPLPEAQLDRFLMEIDVDYPDRDAERRILHETTGAEETLAKTAMNAELLISAQRLVRRLPVGDSVVDAILSLVRSARPGPEGGEAGKLIAWGPGPRASQSLMLAVRARALLDGRLAPSIDDVLDLAEPVLKHRMALTFSARAEGRTIPDVIRQLKAQIG
jgi:MoxR-like ATPase